MPGPESRSGRPEFEPESAAVRPYAVTGGRTRTAGPAYPIEALVGPRQRPNDGLSAERARIVELAAHQYISIAELSAHLHLPMGVVRVLVGDLVADGVVRVHGTAATRHPPAVTLSLLESVLDGLSAR